MSTKGADSAVITWERGMRSLGKAIVAIGVFDGVHAGHQTLLRAVAAEASARGAISVAITFDRDPDQVITPEAASPQLLTLADKTCFIGECGIERVLVVPFDATVASMLPVEFLDSVVGGCCEVLSVHVGSDFRFGARATGDGATLAEWCKSHGARYASHGLFEVDGEPVGSTRIRRLVAAGEVEAAAELLTRPTRLVGRVHEGRRAGRELGFPTANLAPVPYAAVPGDGVYAGRAILADGSVIPAAISIGVPPSYPEARDYVEAHLIGFSGDLYGQEVTLEFFERIRELTRFDGLGELVSAIKSDVARAAEIAEKHGAPWPGYELPFELNPAIAIGRNVSHALGMDVDLGPDTLENGRPVVEDPEALSAAENEVAGVSPRAAYEQTDEEWVAVTEPRRLSGMLADAGSSAAIVTAPLAAAGIPFAWDPYPPEEMPSFRPYYGVFDRPFSLMVPASRAEEARQVLDAARMTRVGSRTHPAANMRSSSDNPRRSRIVMAITWLVLLGVAAYFVASRWSG